MSYQDTKNKTAEHIRDIDARLKEVDQHIRDARQREDRLCHPAPGLELPIRKPEPNGPGQFGA